jgi:hypothetical protein
MDFKKIWQTVAAWPSWLKWVAFGIGAVMVIRILF